MGRSKVSAPWRLGVRRIEGTEACASQKSKLVGPFGRSLLPWPLRSEVAIEKSVLALSTPPLPQLKAKGFKCPHSFPNRQKQKPLD